MPPRGTSPPYDQGKTRGCAPMARYSPRQTTSGVPDECNGLAAPLGWWGEWNSALPEIGCFDPRRAGGSYYVQLPVRYPDGREPLYTRAWGENHRSATVLLFAFHCFRFCSGRSRGNTDYGGLRVVGSGCLGGPCWWLSIFSAPLSGMSVASNCENVL